MKSPESFYNKEECGENEYELYRDLHEVVQEHAQIWSSQPRYVLMSGIVGLFEVYFEDLLGMQRALGLIDQQIQENTERPGAGDSV